MKRLYMVVGLLACVMSTLPLLSQVAEEATTGAGAIVANRMSGSDAGAKINAAFAHCGSVPSCTVYLLPGQKYDYKTPIEIPGSKSTPAIVRPILDCQNSVLNFLGSGDAIVVHGENGAGPATTGGIYNCVVQSPKAHSTAVTSLIHIEGRLGFTLSRLHLFNAQWCLDWENTNSDGGPGYQEDNNFEHIESTGCADHIHAHAGAGATGSFEYNRIDDWHMTLENNVGPEHGLAMVGGTTPIGMQGGFINIKTNTGGNGGATPVALVYLSNGSVLVRSTVMLHGENTGGLSHSYSVDVEDGSSFYATGDNLVDSTTLHLGASSAQYVMHPPLTDVTNDIEAGAMVHMEAESGVATQRRCRFDTAADSARYWLASYGGTENNCEFQILGRRTDDQNRDVYYKGSGSNPPYNIFYINGRDKNVCIGPGYGPKATGGAQCTHSLEVNGEVAARSVATMRGTPASSSEACDVGESWDDANYHYHCVAKNTIKRVALSSF